MSYPLPLKGQKIDDKGVDFEAWLRTSSSSFRSHIAKTFKGSVFRVTLAKANPNRNLGYLNPHLLETNNVMWEQLRPGSELNPWYTIDQWSINDGRDFMYVHVEVDEVQMMLSVGSGTPLLISLSVLCCTVVLIKTPTNPQLYLLSLSVMILTCI